MQSYIFHQAKCVAPHPKELFSKNLVQRFLNKHHIERRIYLQVCDFKNAGVAGYAEAFGIAQL